VLALLARAADALDAAPLHEGLVVQRLAGGLVIREKGVNRAWTWPDQAPLDLLSEAGAVWRPVSWLELLPGDRVIFAGDEGKGQLMLLGAKERKGAADDRGSPKFRWVIVRDREFIESRLAELVPVGSLSDLVVLRKGVSGRVAQLELRGAAGRATIDGFRLRTALDLPDTLFTMNIQHEPGGAIRRVTFVGRGWGHGVGLCQYGAYGMALRGADYWQILAHYYTGVELARLPHGE
jgi:stage II sporulation protein D